MSKIALLDPFHSGSHRQWSLGLQRHSRHEIRIFSLPGRHWKWRMHGAAVTLARQLTESAFEPDLILATDMLDLSILRALTRDRFPGTRYFVYFHENQISYPWSSTDPDPLTGRDIHYAYINFTSALAADRVFFNSPYHLDSFFDALAHMLEKFPDHRLTREMEVIKQKSVILPLGMDLSVLIPAHTPKNDTSLPTTILWNHRWEYDKNPELFFQTLFKLDEEGWPFQLIVTGESYRQSPPIFEEARQRLAPRIRHFGYVDSSDKYRQLVSSCDYLPVTNNQDFFGGSIVEAICMGVFPLLPRRLSYPWLIPEPMHSHFIYEDDNELLVRLRDHMKGNRPPVKALEITMNALRRFDWPSIINEYDRWLSG